jgi:hypothetical protein
MKTIGVLLLLLYLSPLHAVCYEETVVYAITTTSCESPGYWRNGSWINVEKPEGTINFSTSCLAVGDSNVLVGGYIQDLSNDWLPGYWANGHWTRLYTPEPSGKGFISSIIIDENNIYAAGSYYRIGGKIVSGYWKNNEWAALTASDTDGRLINSFTIYQDRVYWTGSYQAWSPNKDTPGYLINKEWIDLPMPKGMQKFIINSITIIDGDIFVLGSCRNEKDALTGYWRNNIWISIASSIASDYESITSLIKIENDIYTSVNKNGYFRNRDWVTVSTTKSYLKSLTYFDNILYCAGHRFENNKFIPGYIKDKEWIQLNRNNEDCFSLGRVETLIITKE